MIGREKSRHYQTWLECRSSLNEKLTAKAELNWEIYKSWRMLEKSSQFLSSAQPCESKSLDVALKSTGVQKINSRKTCGYGQLEAIWFEFWMKGAQMTVEIFVVCGWWFSNQLDIVSETQFSCDTVDRGLWLAILSSLLCPETDRNIRIGKQGYVFYFTDFKKWCFDVSFLTSISVSTIVLTLGKA